ncbi:MAG: 16S rRNA (cytosine(967)-C(5))-methyltransferase RsmB [Arsenophonus endosymbiont of Ceratovacuna japonica]
MNKKYNLRSICAQVISQVIDKKQSLTTVLSKRKENISDKDKSLLQELSFGIFRTLPLLEWFIQQLIIKPLKGNKRIIHNLIIVGIYQLYFTNIPPYAVLSETVNGAIIFKLSRLKNLINGVLRQFQRQKQILSKKANHNKNNYLHPKWLLKKIQQSYPFQWKDIIYANNQKPPMWLRVNQLYNSTYDYFILLQQSGIESNLTKYSKCAIKLKKPCAIKNLIGFNKGWVTIQDLSSQQCVELLSPKNNEYILDLCAAPGGKTTYILEIAPKANVLAVDINKIRIKYIQDNLNRLKLYAKIIVGDGRKPHEWILNKNFDRILLDVPCSSTGIIRRHPDIKWLRKPKDIIKLIKLQYEILESIWPYLKNNGILVYSTCSILPDENKEQIQKFISNHPDAYLSNNIESYKQILPSKYGGDGFFYASLIKNNTTILN